jgi:hypothetical protein
MVSCTTNTEAKPSAVDLHLGLLRACMADSRGSSGGGGTGVQSQDKDRAGGSAPGSRGGDGGKTDRSPGQSSSSNRQTGPKLLDHKLRPLRISKPAPPLLVFSSDLADSYKMVTQVGEQASVRLNAKTAPQFRTGVVIASNEGNHATCCITFCVFVFCYSEAQGLLGNVRICLRVPGLCLMMRRSTKPDR